MPSSVLTLVSVTIGPDPEETLWTWNAPIIDPGDPQWWSVDGNPGVGFDPGDGPNSIRVFTGVTPHIGDGATYDADDGDAVFGLPATAHEYDQAIT